MTDPASAPPADGPVPLLIVGASARAAAFSALRAGFFPVCLDHFADIDLAAVAQVQRVEGCNGRFVEALRSLPSGPAMYVGAIENDAGTLQALAARGNLLGNGPDVVNRVRDPHQITEAFGQAGLPLAELWSGAAPPPADGSWLLKPIHGSGGRGVLRWTAEAADSATLREPHYFQRFIEGDTFSAVFIAPPDRSDVKFVGMTQQLVGRADLNAPPFGWCGSVGPVAYDVGVEHAVRRVGNFLSWRFELCGLFGCDFILDGEGVPRLVEVNPRYPASAEVLECVLAESLVARHAAAFGVEAPYAGAPQGQMPFAAIGKFVLYSDREFAAPDLSVAGGEIPAAMPSLADVPRPGTDITVGHPVCTFFTVGQTARECLNAFPAARDAVLERMFGRRE